MGVDYFLDFVPVLHEGNSSEGRLVVTSELLKSTGGDIVVETVNDNLIVRLEGVKDFGTLFGTVVVLDVKCRFFKTGKSFVLCQMRVSLNYRSGDGYFGIIQDFNNRVNAEIRDNLIEKFASQVCQDSAE